MPCLALKLRYLRNDSLGGLLTGRTSDLGDSGYLAGLNNTLGFQGGLFDFGPQTNNSVKVRYFNKFFSVAQRNYK